MVEFMKRILANIIFLCLSIALIIFPLVANQLISYIDILPSFELIILFYIFQQNPKIKTFIIICIATLFIDLFYDFPIFLSVVMSILGYYINISLESKGYLVFSSWSVTIISRFTIFVFLLLTFRYCAMSIYYKQFFNYITCIFQCIMTICYYPIMHIILSKIKIK